MSNKFLDRLAGKPASISPTAPSIARRIKTAEEQLTVLENEHAEASLAWAAGEAGADTRVSAAQERLDKQHDELRALTAAYGLAQERDAAAERAQRAMLARTQLRSVQQHLAARDAAAEALSAAVTEAAKQWRLLIERSAKARAANPVGGEWPRGAQSEFGEIKKLVQAELHRVGGDPALGNATSFPGAVAPDLQKLGQPEAITPLVDTLKQASAHAIAVLQGRIAE